MTTEKGDLEVLLPGRDINCKGEDLRVLPLFFGQYPKAIKLVRPLIAILQQSGMFGMGRDEQGQIKFQISGEWLAVLPEVLEQGGEALIQFFAFAIAQKREWFDTLPADEGFKLAKAIFEENADFFVRRILPTLNEMGLVKVSESAGGDPSSLDSTATDTAGT